MIRFVLSLKGTGMSKVKFASIIGGMITAGVLTTVFTVSGLGAVFAEEAPEPYETLQLPTCSMDAGYCTSEPEITATPHPMPTASYTPKPEMTVVPHPMPTVTYTPPPVAPEPQEPTTPDELAATGTIPVGAIIPFAFIGLGAMFYFSDRRRVNG